MFQLHGLSTVHFQDHCIRSVSCYTLLSGFRLPWPPSDCLNVMMPFHGNKPRTIYFIITLGAFQSTVSAYQKRSTKQDYQKQQLVKYCWKYTFVVCDPVKGRSPRIRKTLLYCIRLILACYPRRNFGRNQLLGGSISLSPLFTSKMNDLHVSITRVLYQSFLWSQLTHE